MTNWTYWIDGWAGDHAGSVIGRKPNTLLISVHASAEEGYPGGAYDVGPDGLDDKLDLDGVPWYHHCHVECLTPNTLSAFATSITNNGGRWDYVWEIGVRPIDWNRGEDPWTPGVHLFSVHLGSMTPYGNVVRTATFATAVINDRISPHRPDPEAFGPMLWDMQGPPGRRGGKPPFLD